MSGHSKWSKVKHQKATTDVVKAKAFTKASRAITVAVREGGGIADPNTNFKLRLAVEKARDVNMPKENIDRAIAKGKGEGEMAIESYLYEAYGPSGSALLIEAATENRQRTVSQVKNVLDRNNGVLATPGSVSYQFVRVAVLVVIITSGLDQDQLFSVAIEHGATDVVFYDDSAEIYAEPKDLEQVRESLLKNALTIDNAEIVYRPTLPMTYSEDVIQHLDQLVEALSDLEDVQRVYTNIQ